MLLFVLQWLKTSILTLFITILICFLLSIIKFKHHIVKLLGLYMLLNSWIVLLVCMRVDGIYALYYALPLHVCSIVILLEGISVFFAKQLLLEIIYYIGILGSFFALSLPVYVHERTGYLYCDYFIGHALMLIIVYYHVSNGFIPRKYSSLKCYFIFLICAGIVFLINKYFGTNYWYINEDPGFQTGLITSVWPYYILEWFVYGFVLTNLLYLPFRKRR